MSSVARSTTGRPLNPGAKPQAAKFLIAAAGHTQWDVCKALDIQQVMLNRYLNGRALPPAEFAQRLGEFLNVPVSVLFDEVRS